MFSISTNKKYVVVIGASNVDIGGKSTDSIIPEDSNPGTISMSAGGVGRNIAHNLSLLDIPVVLLSAIGPDPYGKYLSNVCTDAGIDFSNVLVSQKHSTSVYLYILNSNGDLEIAINDMSITNDISPEYLESCNEVLQHASAVVFDTNISDSALEYIINHVSVPIFVDPVSTVKALKLKPYLSRIHTLKPNLLEATALTGSDNNSIEAVAELLIKEGVNRVYISEGSAGVYTQVGEYASHVPSISTNVVNATGAGDAFMAGIIWAWYHNLGILDSTKAGIAAATATISSPDTINLELNEDLIKNYIKRNLEESL